MSADPDARRVTKSRQRVLRDKGFARTDQGGFVDCVDATPTNKGESPEFEGMIEGANAQPALANKAYAVKSNRTALKGKHRDRIMRKAAQARPLRASEKRFKKLISNHRFRVEYCACWSMH